MTYAISDIHGRFDKYSAMLEKINFGEDDMLYVLGDIIDRYDEGLKILLDMINRPNIRIIMGNREAMMLDTINAFDVVNEAVFRLGTEIIKMSRLICRWFADAAKQPFDFTGCHGFADYDNQLLYLNVPNYVCDGSDITFLCLCPCFGLCNEHLVHILNGSIILNRK